MSAWGLEDELVIFPITHFCHILYQKFKVSYSWGKEEDEDIKVLKYYFIDWNMGKEMPLDPGKYR